MADVKYYATSHSVNPVDGKPMPNVQLTGSILAECKTEVDAVDGVVTFSAPVSVIEIYSLDTEISSIFTVNGINLHIPAGAPPFKAQVAGTPSASVSVAGATSYILNRYE